MAEGNEMEMEMDMEVLDPLPAFVSDQIWRALMKQIGVLRCEAQATLATCSYFCINMVYSH